MDMNPKFNGQGNHWQNLIDQKNWHQLLEEIDNNLEIQPDNDSLWLLGMYVIGHSGNLSSLYHYYNRTRELGCTHPLLEYTAAYFCLIEEKMEDALGIYLKLNDTPNSQLAQDLIEKARLDYPLIEKAQALEYHEFVPELILKSLLPHTQKQSTSEIKKVVVITEKDPSYALWKETEKDPEPENNQKVKTGIVIAKWFIISFIASCSIAITFFLIQKYWQTKAAALPDYSIQDSAAVLPIRNSKPLVKYELREKLISDFEKAKTDLRSGKVNTARFLLNSILNSNADFLSREKAKIYLNFIPEPQSEELKDNLDIAKIVENPVLRNGSYITWEGELLTMRETLPEVLPDSERPYKNGVALRLLVRSDSNEYLVEAFYESGQITDIQKALQIKSGQNVKERIKVLIFGQYRGLVGTQKNPYIEVIKLWR